MAPITKKTGGGATRPVPDNLPDIIDPAGGTAETSFFCDDRPIILCLSHLRWDFVLQRPQHLLCRAARAYRVVYVQEPVFALPAGEAPGMDLHCVAGKVLVATPRLAAEHDPRKLDILQRQQLDRLLIALAGPVAIAWFYTPMALEFAAHVPAAITVYDCMDELSMFRGASPRLSLLERRLLKKADLVFAGGRSLFEAKRRICGNVHLFPSSVDVTHFHQARDSQSAQPPDQANLPRPRIGFFGVIDERIDYVLLSAMATARPDWHFIMVGPTAKIDPAHLPQHPNLHWIGKRSYDELPAYLAGWDAGIMPFALNDATRFISPTKTPEFLAAAVPLVSTPIADVITDWGNDNLVEIADGPEAMIAALERLLKRPRAQWLANVDERLSKQSWDMIWAGMERLIDRTAIGKSLTDRPRPLDVKRYE